MTESTAAQRALIYTLAAIAIRPLRQADPTRELMVDRLSDLMPELRQTIGERHPFWALLQHAETLTGAARDRRLAAIDDWLLRQCLAGLFERRAATELDRAGSGG